MARVGKDLYAPSSEQPTYLVQPDDCRGQPAGQEQSIAHFRSSAKCASVVGYEGQAQWHIDYSQRSALKFGVKPRCPELWSWLAQKLNFLSHERQV